MKKFEREYNISEYKGEAYSHYFGGLKPCVFDIEATGLSPRLCKVIMTAMLVPTDKGVKITQFLAENHYEEDKVLTATMDFLHEEGIDYLITYNGQTYDVPFVNTRLDMLCLPYQLDLYDFDLYKFLKKHSILPRLLDSLSQASVERFFMIRKDREDTISGKEIIVLFDEYARTGNSQIEKVILTHNREDVLQLYKILHNAGGNEWSFVLDGASFDSAISSYGVPAGKARFSVRPSIDKSRSMLRIRGRQNTDPIGAAYFSGINSPITAMFNFATKSIDINLPLSKYADSFYVDIKALGFEDFECVQLRELETCDAYVNGYLVLLDDGKPAWRAINDLSCKLVSILANR